MLEISKFSTLIFFCFLVTGSSRAADMKFETCGLDGFWILDKVLAKNNSPKMSGNMALTMLLNIVQ
jgi:hypothetical protein